MLRVWVPFHSAGNLRIARMELDREAADYLVRHTTRHLAVSFAASLALVSFTLYFLWSERRAIRFERRQYELEHLAQLGKMAAVLAHEIRNPLGTIKGFVQLALEKADAPVTGLLGPVTNETARLETLVNDLLAYGRPRNPERRRVSWDEIASHVETHATEAIAGRGLRFVREGSLDGIETDPDLLGQVLLNLVRNSIEAVGQEAEGEVRLVAESAGKGYRITVEDNGPGLPVEVRERLFEPFFTTKANGTGLGLSIARRLTEALGGRLEIGDRQPRGTKARLVFE
jgi:signal transduction histidine kinase